MPHSRPFEVICIDAGKSVQIFKGSSYMCYAIYTTSRRGSFSQVWRICLENTTSSFPLSNFTYPNGDRIPEQPIRALYNDNRILYGTIEELRGTKIICDNYSLKTLIGGKLYHISEIKYRLNLSGNVTAAIDKLKIRENGKWYSTYHFEKVDISTNRELEIDSILDSDNSKLKELTTYTRKSETKEEKAYKLLSSVLDAMTHKIKMDQPDLTLSEVIQKRSLSKFNLELSDFSYLNDINWIDFINSNKIK
jgi:hypothetical protein